MHFDKPAYPPIDKPAPKPEKAPARLQRKSWMRRFRIERPDRLDPHRFDGFAQPKSVRVRDPSALAQARGRSACDLCGIERGFLVRIEPAHVRGVGAGGGDVPANLLSLCSGFRSNWCHRRAHTAEIPRDAVLARVKELRR